MVIGNGVVLVLMRWLYCANGAAPLKITIRTTNNKKIVKLFFFNF